MSGKNRKKFYRLIRRVFKIGFLAGVIVFLYPTLSDAWNRYQNQKLIASYRENVYFLDEDEYADIRSAAREYNENHTVNKIVDAFGTAKEECEVTASYSELMNPMGDGIMGYLEIPKINLKLPIYHGVGKEVLEKGVGHIEGTSLPIGGQGTHAVLSAHRGLLSAKLFTDLDQIEKGDRFSLIMLGETLSYEVDQILTVLPEEQAAFDAIAIDPEQDLVTLITCTPYAVNTHRLLVRGHRIEIQNADAVAETTYIPKTLILAGVGAILLLLFVIIKRKKKKTRK